MRTKANMTYNVSDSLLQQMEEELLLCGPATVRGQNNTGATSLPSVFLSFVHAIRRLFPFSSGASLA